jgi:hypothetical protein
LLKTGTFLGYGTDPNVELGAVHSVGQGEARRGREPQGYDCTGVVFSFKEKEEGRRKGLLMEWTRDVEEISLETRSYSVSITMADQLTALLNTNTEFSLILKQAVCIVTTVL